MQPLLLVLLSAASAAASAASSSASSANAKAQKFDSTSGNLVGALTLSSNSASIYSTKTSWTDNTNGWFLGWKEVSANNFTPSINIGGSSTYIKYATDTGLQLAGDIAVSTGDYWKNDGTFRFGGTSGIKRESVGGKIYLGTDAIIQGSVSATSVNTPYAKISEAGVFSITSGSKTTTIGTDATISLNTTSSSDVWGGGGAIYINSYLNPVGNSDPVKLNLNANFFEISRTSGQNEYKFTTFVGDQNAGVAYGDVVIQSSLGMTLKPGNGTTMSSTVEIWGKINPIGGIKAGTYITGATPYTSTAIRNITVSASNPSGGSEGDIWIQI